MILFRFADGKTWVLEPGDVLTVNGQEIPLDSLRSVECIDMGFTVKRGFAQTPEGPVEACGLVLVDADDPERDYVGTGVEVVWPVPPEAVGEVAAALTAKTVRVVRSMPEGLDAVAR